MTKKHINVWRWLPVTFYMMCIAKFIVTYMQVMNSNFFFNDLTVCQKLFLLFMPKGKPGFYGWQWEDVADFFSIVIIFTAAMIIGSFFIKNKLLKWISVLSGILTLFFISYNLGRFELNP